MSIFNNIPFLRITLAFALGIVVSAVEDISVSIFVGAGCFLFVILILLSIKYLYRFSVVWGICAFLFFLTIGAISYSCYNKKPVFADTGTMVATILEAPQEKTNSYKSLVLLHAVNDEDITTKLHEKLIVYFEKSESVENLIPGNQIVFKTTPVEIKNNGNPCEFDYKRYLNNKRIYRQVFLKSGNWQAVPLSLKTPLVWAELLREKLLIIYREQQLGERETEILSALTLGYKRNLDPETKRIFSAAGAMHVLAVSGLHVGIILLIISFLFGFLKKQKGGKILFLLIAISSLWGYAFITGLSPSVLRASTMFCLVVIAQTISKKANIYNSLAASAFLLLLINPNNLFDVGFQLSYSAVFGIVFLQPRFAKLWQVKNKILKFFWGLFTVSLAAQIATFPFSAYYFNQFPTWFLLSNFIVIPAAIFLIPLGLGLLVFSKVSILGTLLSWAVKGIISVVYNLLAGIEAFPFSTIDIAFSKTELLFVVVALLSVFFFLEFRKVNAIKIALVSFLLIAISFSFRFYQQISKNEIIVLNNKEPSVCLIAGRNIYALTNDTLTQNEYLFSVFQSIQRRKRLKKIICLTNSEIYHDKYLDIKDGLVFFNGKTILITKDNKFNNSQSITIASKDSLALNKNIVENNFCIQYNNNLSLKESASCHILSKQGAFVLKY